MNSDGVLVRKMNPEGLYGRRKKTAYVRRTAMPDACTGSVDRAMRTLGLSGARRDRGTRTTIPAKDGIRAGSQSRLGHRLHVCQDVGRFTYVAFIVDVYAQRIVAWHAATTKHTDLVMIPLRMALWQARPRGAPHNRR